MWIIIMFDLPTQEPHHRKAYSKFRNFLLNDGFNMMQYSVYYRYCGNMNQLDKHMGRVKNNLPLDGEVRILSFTDKQFASIRVFFATKEKKIEKIFPQYIFI